MKGLGIDLCGIARIQQAIERNERFLDRYYTKEEKEYILSRGAAGAQSAAAMYAAKEAFLKAAVVGIGRGIALDDIAVSHDEIGAPFYVLTGAALDKMNALGAVKAWLSLSHEGDTAAAVCVIE